MATRPLTDTARAVISAFAGDPKIRLAERELAEEARLNDAKISQANAAAQANQSLAGIRDNQLNAFGQLQGNLQSFLQPSVQFGADLPAGAFGPEAVRPKNQEELITDQANLLDAVFRSDPSKIASNFGDVLLSTSAAQGADTDRLLQLRMGNSGTSSLDTVRTQDRLSLPLAQRQIAEGPSVDQTRAASLAGLLAGGDITQKDIAAPSLSTGAPVKVLDRGTNQTRFATQQEVLSNPNLAPLPPAAQTQSDLNIVGGSSGPVADFRDKVITTQQFVDLATDLHGRLGQVDAGQSVGTLGNVNQMVASLRSQTRAIADQLGVEVPDLTPERFDQGVVQQAAIATGLNESQALELAYLDALSVNDRVTDADLEASLKKIGASGNVGSFRASLEDLIRRRGRDIETTRRVLTSTATDDQSRELLGRIPGISSALLNNVGLTNIPVENVNLEEMSKEELDAIEAQLDAQFGGR